MSGICAPSALHSGTKADAGCGFDRLKWRARAEIAGTTVNVGNLAIAVLQLEATPATARRRYMALAGRGRTALPEVSDARVSRSGQGTTFIIIPEAPLLPLVAVLTGADA